MRTEIVRRPDRVIDRVLAVMEREDRNFSDVVIVFPGRRPAHYILKQLGERTGGAFIPPRIYSIDGFIDHVFTDKLGQTKRPVTQLDAVAALYGIHVKLPARLGSSRVDSPDMFLQLGSKLYRDLEEIAIEQVPEGLISNIDAFELCGVPRQSAIEHLHPLAAYCTAFYRLADERGWATRSQRYRAVADGIAETMFSDATTVIFAGFYALTKTEQKLFARIGEWNNSLFIFQDGPGIADVIQSIGLDAGEPVSPAGRPDVRFYQASDKHGQVFAVAKMLETIRSTEGNPDERTVIVSPSSDVLFPLLHHALPVVSEGGFNVSIGYPLERTPVSGFFGSLARVVTSMENERVYLADYLAFILHPYTKNIYWKGSGEQTRVMMHEIENTARSPVMSLAELEALVSPAMRDHITTIHDRTLRHVSSPASVRDFAERCAGVMTYIYEHSSARLHPYFHPFAETFVEGLAELSASGFGDITFENIASYFNLVKQALASYTVPFEGTPVKGLQVLGFLETRSLSFDRVIVLDVNEDVLPGIGRDDTLIPLKARTALGLPTYYDREKIFAYYFHTLTGWAKEVHLFFADNDRTERSRFVEQLIWEQEKSAGCLDEGRSISIIQYAVDLKPRTPGAIPKTSEMAEFLKSIAYSASTLDAYLVCQRRFYFDKVLRLREYAGADDIDTARVGTIVHEILEKFFGSLKGTVLDASLLRMDAVSAVVDGVFEKEFGAGVSGIPWLIKRQVEKQLASFLDQYQLPAARNSRITVLDVESSMEIEWQGFKLSGTLDRIDSIDGGERIMILDYKTGSRTASKRVKFDRLVPEDRTTWKAVGSLQLPLYAMLYSASAGVPVEKIRPAFIDLSQRVLYDRAELPLFAPEDDIPRCLGMIGEMLGTVLGEIVNPDVPFSPPEKPDDACRYCSFTGICGTL